MKYLSGHLDFDETSAAGQVLFDLAISSAANILGILMFNEDLTRVTTARLYIKNSGGSLRAETDRDLILDSGVNNLIRWPCGVCTDIEVQLTCDGGGQPPRRFIITSFTRKFSQKWPVNIISPRMARTMPRRTAARSIRS